MNGPSQVYQRAESSPADLDLLDGIGHDVDYQHYSSAITGRSRWKTCRHLPFCRPACYHLLAWFASTVLVWAIFVVLMMNHSLQKAVEQESQLRTCINEEVCRELSDNEDSGSFSAHLSSVSDQTVDGAINNIVFTVPENGIYVVYSRLVFRASAASRNKVKVFEHEIRRIEGNGVESSDKQAILRDAQERNCSQPAASSHGDDDVPCHSSLLVSALLLRRGNILYAWTSIETIASIDVILSNFSDFSVTRL